MDQRFWGAAVLVIGLLIAAWIYMDLEKESYERTDTQVKSVIEHVDSITGYRPPVNQRGTSLSERMRSINDLQQRPTDSLKRIIEQDNLLNSQPRSK